MKELPEKDELTDEELVFWYEEIAKELTNRFVRFSVEKEIAEREKAYKKTYPCPRCGEELDKRSLIDGFSDE